MFKFVLKEIEHDKRAIQTVLQTLRKKVQSKSCNAVHMLLLLELDRFEENAVCELDRLIKHVKHIDNICTDL